MLSAVSLALLSAALSGPAGADEPSWTASADARYRNEWDTVRPDDAEMRWRQRVRARLQGEGTAPGQVTFGARLTTGDPTDPNSPYQTLGAGFAKLPASFDRAYLKWSPGGGPSFVEAGKFGSPFAESAVYTDFVWDQDVQPEGVAGKLRALGGKDAKLTWDVTGGAYATVENADFKEDGWLLAAQSSLAVALGKDGKVGLANAVYAPNLTEPGDNALLVGHNQGNGTADSDGDGVADRYISDFAVLDNLVTAKLPMGDGAVDVGARVVMNVAADEDNLGWQVGVAVPWKMGERAIRPYLDVHSMQQDAALSAWWGDDHQSTAGGYLGGVAGVEFTPANKVSLNLWSIAERPIDGAGDDPMLVRVRLDLSVKS